MAYSSRRSRLHKGFSINLKSILSLPRTIRKMPRQQLMLYAGIGLIGMVAVGFLLTFILFAWYGRNLPQPGKLSESRGNSTVFYDRNGKIIYEMYKDKNRVPVEIKDISKSLQQATVAIEDKRFYQHKGISEIDLVRAAISTLMGRTQGASTLTQQLIKNTLLDSERRLSRKIKEAILAYQVERKYTKDQILEMYLNEAPYGGTYWGVGSAARGYFNKSPKDLNLVESAILAGLPQDPTGYSPFIGKNQGWKHRAKDVLRRMREDSYITKAQEEKALKDLEKVKFTTPQEDINAAHFIFYIKHEIEQEFGPNILNDGVKVKTTLDLDIQNAAQEIVKKEIKALEKHKVGNGAMVAMDAEKGEIIAYVGSYDYNDDKFGKFNVPWQGLRQPGSTLKPIEYAVAFEKGYTPSSVLMDVKTEFPGGDGEKPYVPVNYDGKYRGPVQIRYALANSLNVPAVKMLAMIGLRDFLQKSYDMGLEDLEPTQKNMSNLGLSASLGGGSTTLLDLTTAYTVFARGGTKVDIGGVLEITDFKGRKIYEKPKLKEKRVLSEEVSYLISHILSDNNARRDTFGASSYLVVPGKTVAVKTGTTNDKRDNYTVGYTKNVTVGVWVGNNDNTPMNQQIASGVTGASPIWNKVMKELLKKYDDGIMKRPDKIKEVEIDSLLGGLPKDGGDKKMELFIEGTEPKDISPFYKKVKLSKGTNKLANEVEARSGNYDEKDYIVITEDDPVSSDGKNRWQEAINAWASEQGDERFKVPTETSNASSDDVVVSIKNPSHQTTVNSNNVEVRAKIASMHPIKRVKIFVDGNEVKSVDGDKKDFSETINISDGSHEIKIIAWNEKDKAGDSTIRVGINKPWDSSNAPPNTPAPTAMPTTAIPTP